LMLIILPTDTRLDESELICGRGVKAIPLLVFT
jgi:hypothetical protein